MTTEKQTIIMEVKDILKMAVREMKQSDFKGTFAHNDRGLHDAALSCVSTAILLLGLAEEDENRQNEAAA